MNIENTCRIYSEMGLQSRNKTSKLRVKTTLRDDRQNAVTGNDVWAMCFVHASWQRVATLRVLTVFDTCRSLRSSYRGEDVIDSLERVVLRLVAPKPFASMMGRNSSHATWICGHITRAWFWILPDQARRRTTTSSNASAASSGRNA